MNVVFIGAGNVAWHLSNVFHSAGHCICQVWSRNIAHAEELASLHCAQAIDDMDVITADADCYVIAVPDDYIAGTSARMPEVSGIVLHTSGSVPLSALCQPRCAVVWFPHSFVKDVEMDYSSLQCCYEGSSADVEARLSALLDGVARRTYRLDSQQRRWAHLASVITNNFAHALNTLAEEIAISHGIDFAMLYPLIVATAESAKFPGLASRQTGPAARNDTATLAAHRSMLASNPGALRVYDDMTALVQSFQKSDGKE